MSLRMSLRQLAGAERVGANAWIIEAKTRWQRIVMALRRRCGAALPLGAIGGAQTYLVLRGMTRAPH